jgi:hypothetical protein
MPNLNMTSATYAASATSGFGQALTGGYGATATTDVVTLGSSFCVEALASMSAVPAAIKIVAAQYKAFTLGVNTSGYPYATYGFGNTQVTLTGSSSICDGTERWLTLEVDVNGGGKLYVGATGGGAATLVASSTVTPQQAGVTYVIAVGASGVAMDVGSFRSSGSTTNDWTSGTISEVALWQAVRTVSGVYTPPTAPYAGTEQDLKALWHLDGNGTDSKSANGATATGYTVSCPTVLGYNVANQISVIANGYLASPVVVTLTGSGGSGTVSGTATLPAGAPVRQHITYTPTSSVGSRKLTFTNNGGLANPAVRDAFAISGGRIVANNANIIYSPYNWLVDTNGAKTVNAGAYFRTIFNGTYAELEFDTSNNAGPLPMIAYSLDGGLWVRKRIASSVTIDIDPANCAANHSLVVIVDAMTQQAAGLNRWSGTQQAGVIFKAIKVSGSTSLRLPQRRDKNAILYGDSISEGINVISFAQSNAVQDDIVCNSSTSTWAYELGVRLNAEIGIVAFGSQGYTVGGSLGVPNLASAYSFMWSGQARDFSTYPIDYAIICHGTNDGSANTQANGLTVVNALLASSSKAMVFVFRPYGSGPAGLQAANLQAIVSGCNDPTRVRYIDTNGVWSTADSFDSTHPVAFAHMGLIMPKALTLTMNRGVRAARTVTSTVVDATGTPRANLTGLKWTYFDKPNPSAFDTITDSGSGATTDANGVLTLTVNSVQGAGATGFLVLSDSDGTTTQSPAAKAFSAPVTLS